MSREALQESLSAVMDNEADELELRRVLAVSGDLEWRARWSRYQLARAAMRKELVEPRLNIAAAVSAALADEPLPARGLNAPWRSVGRIAVAASVTLAVLAGVRLYNQDELNAVQLAQQAAQPTLSAPVSSGPVLLAGFSGAEQASAPAATSEAQTDWHARRLPGYVRQHAQQAALSAGDSPLPYARAASLESR